MPGPGLARPDHCSIHAAAEHEDRAEEARARFTADGYPPGDDDPPAPLTNGIDRAIRLSTAVAVLAVAGIAAYGSYWHAYAVVRAHGETGITARLEPATIDGLVYASSMVVLDAAPAPGAGTLPDPLAARARNRGHPHGEHGPGLVPRSRRGGGRGARRPAGQAAGLPAIPASGQRDDELPEASAVNDAAVAAYRLSVQAGNPLSERRLAQMFGRTSRRWARARIADARQPSSIQDSPGIPAMA